MESLLRCFSRLPLRLVKDLSGRRPRLLLKSHLKPAETADLFKIKESKVKEGELGLESGFGKRGIVERSDTIEKVKEKIQAKDGTPANVQDLYLEGKKLENGHTLADYNVEEQDILDLFHNKLLINVAI
ncbi:hypothetical protein Sjap_025299 [Stephania japonica]|uniref:Ubiquitin-like domain-containing protein n=1 Tax=Stephania japonica TaxID=461633 RepID=A0AAP0E4L0_9MAGN